MLRVALPFVVSVQTPEACAALDRVLADPRWDTYGPVLFERALRAYAKGDLGAARAATATAASVSALDTRPALLWATIEWTAGEPEAALAVIGRGLTLARRWDDPDAARDLYALQGRVLDASGRSPEAAWARLRFECVADSVPVALCASPLGPVLGRRRAGASGVRPPG